MSANKKKKSAVSRYLSRIGKKGGQAKVAKGLAKLTPEERREVARKGAKTRWAKKGLKAVALALLLLLPVRASAEKAHAWETATVLSQQITGGTGGVFAAPLGGGVMGVPIYRRSNRIVLETPQYRFTLDEVGRKALVVVVHDTVQYYRDGKYFIMLDAEKHKHKFVMTGIEKRQ